MESPETISISGTSTSTEESHSRESSFGSNTLIQEVCSSAATTATVLNSSKGTGNKLRSPPISPSGSGSSASSFISVQTKKTLKLSKVKSTDPDTLSGEHRRSSSQNCQPDGGVSKSPLQIPASSTLGGSEDVKFVSPLIISTGIAEEINVNTRSSSLKGVISKQKTPSNASKPPSHGGVPSSIKSETASLDNLMSVSLNSLPSKARAPIGEPTDSLLTIIADVRASLTQQHVQKLAETDSINQTFPAALKTAWTFPPALPDYSAPVLQQDDESTHVESAGERNLGVLEKSSSITGPEKGQNDTSQRVAVVEKNDSVIASYSVFDDDADDIDAILNVGMDDEHLTLSLLPPQTVDVAVAADINDSPLFYYSNNLLEGDDILTPGNDVAALITTSPSLEDMEFKKETELNPEAAPFETFASRTANLKNAFYPSVLLEPSTQLSTSPEDGFHNDSLSGYHLPTYSSELGTHLGVGFDFTAVDYPYAAENSLLLMQTQHQQLQAQPPLNHLRNSSRIGSSLLTSSIDRQRRTRCDDTESIFSSYFEDTTHNLFTNPATSSISSTNMSSESFSTSPPQAPPPGLAALNNTSNRLSFTPSKANDVSSHISFSTNSNITQGLYDSSNSSFLSRPLQSQTYKHTPFQLPGRSNSLSARMSSKTSMDSDVLVDHDTMFNADKFFNELDLSDEEEHQEEPIIPLNANPLSIISSQLRSSPTTKNNINSLESNKMESIYFSNRFATSPTELTTMDIGGWGISPPHSNTINRAGFHQSSPTYRSQRVSLHSRTGSSGAMGSGSVRTSREMLQPQAQTQIPSEYLHSVNQQNNIHRRAHHPLHQVIDETTINPNSVLNPQNKPSAKF